MLPGSIAVVGAAAGFVADDRGDALVPGGRDGEGVRKRGTLGAPGALGFAESDDAVAGAPALGAGAGSTRSLPGRSESGGLVAVAGDVGGGASTGGRGVHSR
jgi:hypothetical protein